MYPGLDLAAPKPWLAEPRVPGQTGHSRPALPNVCQTLQRASKRRSYLEGTDSYVTRLRYVAEKSRLLFFEGNTGFSRTVWEVSQRNYIFLLIYTIIYSTFY
jgi:hypothetical protein